MNLLAALLLGHLIGDFPLQTNQIYRLKSKSWLGIVLHAVVHVVITALCRYVWLCVLRMNTYALPSDTYIYIYIYVYVYYVHMYLYIHIYDIIHKRSYHAHHFSRQERA